MCSVASRFCCSPSLRFRCAAGFAYGLNAPMLPLVVQKREFACRIFRGDRSRITGRHNASAQGMLRIDGYRLVKALPARLGRNTAFDRAGNVFIAAFIGVVGVAYSQRAPFYLAPLFAALTTIAVLSIPARAIDHDKARGLEMEGPTMPGFLAAGASSSGTGRFSCSRVGVTQGRKRLERG
jgi:hypothetical protein